MKVIIIGSGISGLATAVRLAVAGHEVTVYEANNFTGGKLSSFELGRYRFDAGPSLFTMPQFVTSLFELAGENPKDYFKYNRKEIGCKYFWKDGKILNAFGDQNLEGHRGCWSRGQSYEQDQCMLELACTRIG